MTFTNDGTTCSACGSPINLALDPPGGRNPCADCGATARTVGATISESVTVRDALSVKAKRPGQKKPFVEDMSTPSFSVSKQKLVHRHRLIDRDNDKYVERVTDYETGDTIRHCEEPLSKHTGHGSVRKKSKNGDPP